jgi:dihydroorotase
MSAFLALGLPIDKVIECSTANPASIIGKSEEIGCLSPGAIGDVAVIELCKGNFFFEDPYGNTLEAKQMLTPVLTISKGQIQQASSSVTV